MNRLMEWYFIQIKMKLGRDITEKDILEHFNANCNCRLSLQVRVWIGGFEVEMDWGLDDLITEFKSNN